MALEDRSYDRRRANQDASFYHGNELDEMDDTKMDSTSDGFDGIMIGHAPRENNKDEYNNAEYASTLQMKSSSENHHIVGGGGGGATFIFKVNFWKVPEQISCLKLPVTPRDFKVSFHTFYR